MEKDERMPIQHDNWIEKRILTLILCQRRFTCLILSSFQDERIKGLCALCSAVSLFFKLLTFCAHLPCNQLMPFCHDMKKPWGKSMSLTSVELCLTVPLRVMSVCCVGVYMFSFFPVSLPLPAQHRLLPLSSLSDWLTVVLLVLFVVSLSVVTVLGLFPHCILATSRPSTHSYFLPWLFFPSLRVCRCRWMFLDMITFSPVFFSFLSPPFILFFDASISPSRCFNGRGWDQGRLPPLRSVALPPLLFARGWTSSENDQVPFQAIKVCVFPVFVSCLSPCLSGDSLFHGVPPVKVSYSDILFCFVSCDSRDSSSSSSSSIPSIGKGRERRTENKKHIWYIRI